MDRLRPKRFFNQPVSDGKLSRHTRKHYNSWASAFGTEQIRIEFSSFRKKNINEEPSIFIEKNHTFISMQ